MPIYKLSGQKRDGYQKYRVVVNYTEPGGEKKRVERVAYGKEAALRTEEELRNKIRAGSDPLEEPKREKRNSCTVKELVAAYREAKQCDVRQTTAGKKQSIQSSHILPFLGEDELRRLDAARMSEWRAWMNRKEIGVTMKRNAYRELRAVLNWAVAAEMIPANPIKKIKDFSDPYLETSKKANKVRYYTKEEFQKFYSSAASWASSQPSLRNWGIVVFFAIAYYTGARKGEISALKWSDLEKDTIHIRRSISQKVKGTRITETPPKNESSIRTIQAPVPLMEILETHKARQKTDSGWSEGYRICGGPDVIPDTTIENANQRFAKLAGIKKITIHEFRHSHASLLCNAGINIQEVARRLGHSNPEITMRIYAHLYPQESERATEVLNRIEVNK